VRAAGGAPLASADLGVSIVVAPDAVTIGQTLTYTVTATNGGPDQATGIEVSDSVSGAGATYTSATSEQGRGCTISTTKGSIHCELGTLASGASTRITALAAAASAGNVVNKVSITGKEPDPNASNQQAQLTTHVAETQPPTDAQVGGTVFTRPVQNTPSFDVSWSAKDTGSGVAGYDVRYRAADVTSAFGEYVDWQTAVTSKRATFVGRPGWSYCFSVRATDRDGNVSDWSAERCAAIMLGPATATRVGPWSVSPAAGSGSASVRTSTKGAKLRLRNVAAKQIYLLAVACPGCGTVRVFWNGRLLRVIALGARVRATTLIPVPAFPELEHGTLLVNVVSSRRTVTLKGLGIVKV
jgi:uncharacterized repeat protein (TIGR01451 family)